MVGRFEVIRESHSFAVHLTLAYRLEFFAPFRDQLVFIDRRCGDLGVGHGYWSWGKGLKEMRNWRASALSGTIIARAAFGRDLVETVHTHPCSIK
jgi:hypothetical protein